MNAICVAGTVFISGIIKWAIQTQSFHHGVYILLGHIQIDIVTPRMNKAVEGDRVMTGLLYLGTAIMESTSQEGIFAQRANCNEGVKKGRQGMNYSWQSEHHM